MMKRNTLLVCIGTNLQIILDYPVITANFGICCPVDNLTLLLYPQLLNCVNALSDWCNINMTFHRLGTKLPLMALGLQTCAFSNLSP